jgi:predicted nucleotidyltransferase
MDKNHAIMLAKRYALEVTKELQPEKIVLYGSYAAGSAKEESDIDVAVICNGFTGDFLGVSSWLCSLTWNISSSIEPIFLDRAHDQTGFIEEIIKTGEVIYPA